MASGADIDQNVAFARPVDHRVELILEEFAEHEPRVECAIVNLRRIDIQLGEAIGRLALEPGDQRLFEWRNLDAGDVRQHRRIVPTGTVRRTASGDRLLLEYRHGEGPRRTFDQSMQGVDRGRASTDECNGRYHRRTMFRRAKGSGVEAQKILLCAVEPCRRPVARTRIVQTLSRRWPTERRARSCRTFLQRLLSDAKPPDLSPTSPRSQRFRLALRAVNRSRRRSGLTDDVQSPPAALLSDQPTSSGVFRKACAPSSHLTERKLKIAAMPS